MQSVCQTLSVDGCKPLDRHDQNEQRCHQPMQYAASQASSLMHLQAIHSKPSSRLVSAALQLCDLAVVHILLLFVQEVGRDCIEGVAGQLVVALDGSEDIQLHTPVNGDFLVLMGAMGLARELGIPDLQPPATGWQLSLEAVFAGRKKRRSCASAHDALYDMLRVARTGIVSGGAGTAAGPFAGHCKSPCVTAFAGCRLNLNHLDTKNIKHSNGARASAESGRAQ